MTKSDRILVTGADGFIGSHLAERLVADGYNVRAFCYYNSFNSWGWIDTLPASVKEKLEIFMGDIRDPYGVRKAVEGVDVIFHLAALIAIPFSYHSPDSYVDTNVRGTLNVLQAARDSKARRVLVTSTSEVYGTAIKVPIDESHPRQAQSPYSATKIAADALADSFYRSFNLPVTIVRPFNTYGPRQSARAVIPTIITQLLNGKLSIDLGDTTPTRDLVYVKDTVEGFLKIANCAELIGHEVNIATGAEVSVGDLAKSIIQQIEPRATVKQSQERMRPDKSEVFRLCGSFDKLKSLTSWQPGYTLEQGLRETISWYSSKDNLKHYKGDIYNL